MKPISSLIIAVATVSFLFGSGSVAMCIGIGVALFFIESAILKNMILWLPGFATMALAAGKAMSVDGPALLGLMILAFMLGIYFVWDELKIKPAGDLQTDARPTKI